jgi:triosephosphate isomerase
MLVAGNWKMNLGLEQSCSLAAQLAAGLSPDSGVEVAIFPQFPWILAVREAVGGAPIGVGAQNGHPGGSGAFTGEVSIELLAAECRYILAGHSERRHLFGESDGFVGEKVRAIVAAGCRAILCVGETLEERQRGDANTVVVRQLQAGCAGLDANQFRGVTIAYEPVWAIGTGVPAKASDAQAMCAEVRRWIRDHFGSDAAEGTRILYGGSITPDNARELFGLADVDGGLVGGASLKAEGFLAIVAAAAHRAGL